MHNGGFEKIGNNAEVFSDFGKEMVERSCDVSVYPIAGF